MVFTPADPKLYTLNPNAWLILELCDGRTPARLETAYLEAVVPPLTSDAALAQLRQGLELLRSRGIIEWMA